MENEYPDKVILGRSQPVTYIPALLPISRTQKTGYLQTAKMPHPPGYLTNGHVERRNSQIFTTDHLPILAWKLPRLWLIAIISNINITVYIQRDVSVQSDLALKYTVRHIILSNCCIGPIYAAFQFYFKEKAPTLLLANTTWCDGKQDAVIVCRI